MNNEIIEFESKYISTVKEGYIDYISKNINFYIIEEKYEIQLNRGKLNFVLISKDLYNKGGR